MRETQRLCSGRPTLHDRINCRDSFSVNLLVLPKTVVEQTYQDHTLSPVFGLASVHAGFFQLQLPAEVACYHRWIGRVLCVLACMCPL
jgi:hypothetical protein